VARDAVFERFVRQSPLPVMTRLLMQRALSPEWLEAVFEQHRQRQYTRELLFSTEVELITLVALGLRPSLHAAAQASDELKVSMQALYDKVHPTPRELVRVLVQGSGERLTPVVQELKLRQPPWAAGYRVRVLDGNHLAASQKRRPHPLPARGVRSAAAEGTAAEPTWRAGRGRVVHSVLRVVPFMMRVPHSDVLIVSSWRLCAWRPPEFANAWPCLR